MSNLLAGLMIFRSSILPGELMHYHQNEGPADLELGGYHNLVISRPDADHLQIVRLGLYCALSAAMCIR